MLKNIKITAKGNKQTEICFFIQNNYFLLTWVILKLIIILQL